MRSRAPETRQAGAVSRQLRTPDSDPPDKPDSLPNLYIAPPLGPFTIEREFGRVGMGEVYLARDTRLDRLARFQREAKVLASLNHPGIGAIYGLEEANGHQYLILEFVEGETLADRLGRA